LLKKEAIDAISIIIELMNTTFHEETTLQIAIRLVLRTSKAIIYS
jgi:hypothetical protein